MLEFIPLEEARRILFENSTSQMQVEYAPLTNSCGRMLSENLTAQINIPPFNRSAVDGFALNTNNLNNLEFTLVGNVPAGHSFAEPLPKGTCVRIFTGAPIPAETTTIVRQEDVQVESNKIFVKRQFSLGDNIACCGEDVKTGDLLLEAGTVINPACVGILASQGITQVPVFRRPKVGILSTGDELVLPGEPLKPGSIYNSNLFSIASLVENLGAEAVLLGTVEDSLEAISDKLIFTLPKVDVVVTTGGSSVGDYDVVKEAISNIGGDVLFWRVAIKPGTPVIAGRYNGKLFLGLSGNPAAALIGAELLLAPLLRKMMGYRDYSLETVKAVVNGRVDKANGIRRMLRVSVEKSETGLVAQLPAKQKSGILKSLAECNGVLDLGPRELINEGERYKVILFNRWE